MISGRPWQVSLSVVERIWRREGLKVPKRQPKRCRLWLGDGSCIRLRPQHRGHVWSYDFVEDQTHNGRKFRMLNVIDEFSRECLAMVPLRRFRSNDVIDVLADLFIEHGPPEYIRSDNGPEFVANAVREWLGRLGVTTLYIEPGSPWENGYIERLASPPFGSTPACEMSCSTARSSTASRRCGSSPAGGATTTTGRACIAVWATDRRRRKR
jgi:transposase InsO family protein